MIRLIDYKHEKAIQLENDYINVIVLPRLGGKIASYYHKAKSFEALYQNTSDQYGNPNIDSKFSEFTPSGFDDCFPTIEKGPGTYGDKLITYPDHGETWYSVFDYVINEDYIELTFNGSVLPYNLVKRISIKDYKLKLSYEITNRGTHIIDNFYTLHALFNCEEDMIINFPTSTKEVINVGPYERLGDIGTIHRYPKTTSINGEDFYLNKIQPASSFKYEKYYDINQVTSGHCSYTYPSHSLSVNIDYDPVKLPYIGFYVSQNEFAYNCAIEPSNGFYDSMDTAKANKKYHQLLPNDTFSFDLQFEFV